MQIGYKIATEAFTPKQVVEQAVAAERAGFDFVELSDHYHPWLEAQGHSGFTWSMLGAMAARTERVGLVTGMPGTLNDIAGKGASKRGREKSPLL